MQIRWCSKHIVFLFFCNCASLHSLPPSSRGTIKVTEHVSKIYASVTNYNALSLISPLLLLSHRFSYVFAFWGGLGLWVLVFSKFSPPSLFSLHINVSLDFTSAETGGCNPSESTLVFDSLQDEAKSILELHFFSLWDNSQEVTLRKTAGRTGGWDVSFGGHTW